jgi:uncharacterized protein DUF6228
MTDLEIRCTHRSSLVRLSRFKTTGRGAYDESEFDAAIESKELSARVVVPDIVSNAWHEFFSGLAQHQKGWPDTRTFKSVEGHLRFDAKCDALGHVELVVTLRDSPLYKGWSAELPLHLELGQLDDLAKRVRKFFEA